jgi:hypothetical protein
MQLVFSKTDIPDPEQFMRRAGYGIIFDRQNRRVKSFVKRIHGDLYPRFHLYIEDRGVNWSFNLHLDQRAPVYAGVTAHAGEYDGVVLEKEAERIKQFFKPSPPTSSQILTYS